MRFFITLIILSLVTVVGSGQGFTPSQAVQRMQLPDGFTVTAVATEPMIRQPLSISFDDRGRMWVLQYLQYPTPAGLKPVKQDQYLRTVWDRVLPPPPAGPKGLDRLTICYDPDDRGVYQQSKDFLTGLNLASGFCLGHGGVYVMQPPYLLFYPDKNRDDRPDGDPTVLLNGFGLDDTHSVANSLQWGPDGWLYGAAGSTSTCRIANPASPKEIVEFQQGIWRYHPETHQFELFSEGGGNTFGLDFDQHGQIIAGTNWGGYAMLHQMQGAYHVKGFSKHGPLHNPHTYGYFEHVPYKNFQGGHVTCGGIVYQAETFPAEMRNQYIAGNLLSNAIYWHRMSANGSTFQAQHGGDLLVSNDTWYRPVDLMLGPDGSVYMADWYDRRAAHLDPIDNWDRTNGRIYKIEYRGTSKLRPFDLSQKTTGELVELLNHSNVWWRREARRMLVEKADSAAIPELRSMLSRQDRLALEALWTLSQLPDGLTPTLARQMLTHENEHVRAWAVRLITDRRIDSAMEDLIRFTTQEKSPVVLAQLACSAKRLPESIAWPIIEKLTAQNDNIRDPYVPLLTWWAMEQQMTNANGLSSQRYARLLPDSTAWKQPMMVQYLLERLVQRVTAFPESRPVVAQLLKDAPDAVTRLQVVKGLNAGIVGRKFELPPREWVETLENLLRHHGEEQQVLRLAVRLGHEGTRRRLLDEFQHASDLSTQIQSLQILAEVRDTQLPPALVRVCSSTDDAKLRTAILAAMTAYSDPTIDRFVLSAYPAWKPADRAAARRVLFTRPATAKQLLETLQAKKIPVTEVPISELRPLLGYQDAELTRQIEKLYGQIGPATPGEKQARISWVGVVLSRGKGEPKSGQALFKQHCANCHQLFGEGNKIGPDLTTADRKNTAYMLANIIDPSSYIRTESIQHEASTVDGRKISGIVVASDSQSITIVDAQNRQTIIARNDLEELKPSTLSLMPEKLLDTLTDQQICDLFAYLRTDPPNK